MQVYHVSRESFLYLSEFYIGEIAPEDRPLVPVLEVHQGCQVLSLHVLFMLTLKPAQTCKLQPLTVICAAHPWQSPAQRALRWYAQTQNPHCRPAGAFTRVPAAAAGVHRFPHEARRREGLQEFLMCTCITASRSGHTCCV